MIVPMKPLTYGSVCSGIEAASAAWETFGWKAAFFSEIEPFPCAVLAHHYPTVPNHGDMTKFKEWPDAAIDVLIGGTPCQSFSVAGLRKGLDDPRGNLMLTFGEIAGRYRPRWLVWENVPGVLSSGSGLDFAAFLGLITGRKVYPPRGSDGGLTGWGGAGIIQGHNSAYSIAWRTLDAQYFGVAQRRRRVFVVGHLGDWRRAAAVLLERESLSGNPPPRREAGKGFARGVEIGPSGGSFTDLNPTLDSRDKDGPIRNQLAGAVYHSNPHAPISPAIKARDGKGVSSDGDGDGAILVPMVAHTLRAEHDASEDGTGRGTPLIPTVAKTLTSGGTGARGYQDPVNADLIPVGIDGSDLGFALRAEGSHSGDKGDGGMNTSMVVAFPAKMSGTQTGGSVEELSPTLGAENQTAIAFDTTQITSPGNYSKPKSGDPCHPLAAGAHAPAVAFPIDLRNAGRDPEKHDAQNRQGVGVGNEGDPAGTVSTAFQPAVAFSGRSRGAEPKVNRPERPPLSMEEKVGALDTVKPWNVATSMQVRRLTPMECLRLQGFPDDYLDILFRSKPAADGPKYKAVGNSMAVTVIRWIGQRIQAVEAVCPPVAAAVLRANFPDQNP